MISKRAGIREDNDNRLNGSQDAVRLIVDTYSAKIIVYTKKLLATTNGGSL